MGRQRRIGGEVVLLETTLSLAPLELLRQGFFLISCVLLSMETLVVYCVICFIYIQFADESNGS
jgi:hypothetical protein